MIALRMRALIIHRIRKIRPANVARRLADAPGWREMSFDSRRTKISRWKADLDTDQFGDMTTQPFLELLVALDLVIVPRPE
jgi:hypothetical protein